MSDTDKQVDGDVVGSFIATVLVNAVVIVTIETITNSSFVLGVFAGTAFGFLLALVIMIRYSSLDVRGIPNRIYGPASQGMRTIGGILALISAVGVGLISLFLGLFILRQEYNEVFELWGDTIGAALLILLSAIVFYYVYTYSRQIE